ncbi:MAG: hypothetical protein GEU91_18360 [Rhizobiales bacterium]|nr:hypothetical protein [Hyphomicrobiales bacterium]
MPLHIRRYTDVWPDGHWSPDQYLVINNAGCSVGTIQHNVAYSPPWYWAINGAIVQGAVDASGQAGDIETCKRDLARNWRRWLALRGEGEDYRPPFGSKLSIEDRRRLRLPG